MAVTRINIGNITVGDDTIRIGAVTTRNTNRATNASTPLLKGEKGDKRRQGRPRRARYTRYTGSKRNYSDR